MVASSQDKKCHLISIELNLVRQDISQTEWLESLSAG